jgi:hypothetical protein
VQKAKHYNCGALPAEYNKYTAGGNQTFLTDFMRFYECPKRILHKESPYLFSNTLHFQQFHKNKNSEIEENPQIAPF